MELRRLFACALWLATTVAATALVWMATSVVAHDVTDRAAPVVAHRDVVIALAAGNSGSSSPDPTTTVPAGGVTSLAPAAGAHSGSPRAPATATTGPSSQATILPGQALAPPPNLFPPLAPTTTPTAAPKSSTTVPHPVVTTSTTQPAAPTATYSTVGGVVTVACTGPSTIRMVSASPNDGFRIDHDVKTGPSLVEVHFIGPDDYTVQVACFLGQPVRVDDGGRRTGD